jgi:hypothetical protein
MYKKMPLGLTKRQCMSTFLVQELYKDLLRNANAGDPVHGCPSVL